MRILAPIIENPWCLVLGVAIAVLVISAAALVARVERTHEEAVDPAPVNVRASRLLSAAPFQAMAGLHERLLDLQQRLPTGSDEKHWLGHFAGRLRQVMDEIYDQLEDAPVADQPYLLDRLGEEVEALTTVVNLQLGVTLSKGTDRQALETQLAALPDSIK